MSYLILGATGTLGQAMIEALGPDARVKALSRDELKLSELKKKFPHVQTVIGDIRDKSSIAPHFKNIHTVFHFAALKRIPEMEAQPIESLKTNVLGTINAAECAIENNVAHFVFSSTDKACLPVNAYGASKFLSEKILLSLNNSFSPNFSVYRWGNVLGSRGSVVYSFNDTIKNEAPAHVTHQEMTRFWIRIEAAIKFILDTYQQRSNEVRIPKMKSASVLALLDAIALKKKLTASYKITGMRPGEKIHEHISFIDGQLFGSSDAERYTTSELTTLLEGII